MINRWDQVKIITPCEVIESGTVIVGEDGRIEYLGPSGEVPQSGQPNKAYQGYTVAPGFVDIHVHGGNGITFGVGDIEDGLRAYSKWVAATGVTGFLTSIAAPNHAALLGLLSAYADAMELKMEGAQPLGIHMEGPFINRKKKGAFNPEWLRSLTPSEVEECLEASRGWIRQVTISPELPDAVEAASRFHQAGVMVAMGHTDADFDLASEALKGDFTHVTHTFNAQRGFDHRAPGVFGAVLASDGITAELIADTVHVHKGAMKILVRCLGSERVVLVTDAMAGAGLDEGTYDLVGFPVTVKDGKATLVNGTLAGSIATLDQCVRNMVREVGLSAREAIQMASLNPARCIGLKDRMGHLAMGMKANLVLLNENLHVCLTMVDGKIVHQAS